MLDIDYHQGLAALSTLVQRQKPELLPEFSAYQFRLIDTVSRQQTYGSSSDEDVKRSEVLDRLTQFTNTHFALQFIDLCRHNTTLNQRATEEHLPASTPGLHAMLWQGGSDVLVQGTRYLLHAPVEMLWTPDRSALLQQAQAQEIGAERMVLLKQVQLQRATPDAEAWKSALEKEGRLLDALEQNAQQSFPRRLTFVTAPRSATLVQSLLSGQSWQETFGRSDVPLSTQATRSLLRSAIALCESLKALHAKKVAHRALHPAKILQLTDRRCVCKDSGLATWKYIPGEGPELYRAPEQAIANTTLTIPGRHTDIYQLGMILYHLITGSQPIPNQLLPLHAWNAELPGELDTILQRAIASNPRERWPTIADFSFALKKVTR